MDSLGEHVEALLDAVPDALVGVDRAGMIRFVNRSTEKLFGYEPADLLGLPIEVLLPESARAAHRVHREGYNSQPRVRDLGIDLRLSGRRRDGTQFPVHVALSPLETQEGLLVIAAVRDITDAQEANQKRDQINRLLAAIEYSHDAIIAIKLDGVITSWNHGAADLFGYQSQEILGRPARILIPKDRLGHGAAVLTRVEAGEAVENLETMAVRKDASVFPVSVTVSPIYDESGAVMGAAATARDMTKAQQWSESARSMIESSLDSLVAISPEGKITDVNEATVKVTGVPRDQLIGTSFSKYFTDPEKADRIYKLVFSEGMALDYALTMRHQDGTLTEVLYNASVHRDTGGAVVGVFAAARDVTKQVRAQRELAEQREKERARLGELERFQAMTIDRALKVIELKKEIETLKGFNDTEAGESDDQW